MGINQSMGVGGGLSGSTAPRVCFAVASGCRRRDNLNTLPYCRLSLLRPMAATHMTWLSIKSEIARVPLTDLVSTSPVIYSENCFSQKLQRNKPHTQPKNNDNDDLYAHHHQLYHLQETRDKTSSSTTARRHEDDED